MIPRLSVPASTTKSVLVNAFRDGSAITIRDAVQLVANVRPSFQPDLMIRRDGDDSFAGEGIFNGSGLGQARVLEVGPGETATYRVQLRNHGNATNRIRLQASTPGAGWTARFCGIRPVLRFDGTDDHVSIANSPDLHSDRQLSVAGWFRAEGFPRTWQNIVWKGNNPDCTGGCENREYAVWLNAAGYLLLTSTPTNRIGVGELSLTTPPNLIRAGEWFHFAAVIDSDANRMQLYVNGELKAEGPYSTAGIRTSTGPLQIGMNTPGQWMFQGAIRDISLWDRALDATAIVGLVSANPSGAEAALLGYWTMMDGGGLAVADHSVHGNTGVLINGVTWGFDTAGSNACFDLAPAIHTGWTNLVLPPKGTYDLLVRVTPDAGTASGSSRELILTASSMEVTGAADVAKAITAVRIPSAVAQGGTYTSTLDFDKGRLSGVDSAAVADQLQLSDRSAALHYLWVPNNEGTISKVDTLTGRELARYRTGPTGVNGQPSRTTVDLFGSCYVANRYSGTILKLGLSENGQGIDRNGDGLLQSSRDLNQDGDISPDEVLPWGQDESVLWETSLIPTAEGNFVPGTFTGPYQNSWGYPGVRGVAVDDQGNVWVGTLETKKIYYLEGSTGRILRTIDVAPVNHRTYGAVLDRSGILWASSHDRNQVLRLDPATDRYTVLPLGHFSYGINVDRDGHVFVSGWNSGRLSRIDSATAAIEWNLPIETEGRGIGITDDGDLWIAHSGPGVVVRRSNSGAFKASIPVGSQPSGVSVDSRGMVWAMGLGDDLIRRIDPYRNVVDLTKRIVAGYKEGYHYGYSDMTGTVARNSTTRIGFWTVIHDSSQPNTPWGAVTWQAEVPEGTAVRVRVRSSENQGTWSLWESAQKGVPLHSTPTGRFLEIEVTLQSRLPGVSPLLTDLTVQPASESNLGVLFYANEFTGNVGPEWSDTPTATTPSGGRRFLGEFGNETVTLTLTNLPPHAAATLVFDQFVLRGWDGNSTTDGPDLFEVNLAGGLQLVRSTFHNGPAGSAAHPQSYPDAFPGGVHPARTGAFENDTLGFVVPGAGVSDSVYRHTRSFSHTANTLTLNFIGSGLAALLSEESWGLDNLRVYLVPLGAAPELRALGFGSLGFEFEVTGEPGWNYTVEASTDLITWQTVLIHRPPGGTFQGVDLDSSRFDYRFYRASRTQ